MPSKAAEFYKHYATAFSAISDEERRKILEATVATGVIYRIPRIEGTGHQIILDDIHEFQTNFPGRAFCSLQRF